MRTKYTTKPIQRTNLSHLTPEEKKKRKNQQSREWWARHKNEQRGNKARVRMQLVENGWFADYILKYRYGISMKDFQQMIDLQNNKCAICETTFGATKATKPHVDHNHITGKVRSLLCNFCNRGLGQFKDNYEIVEKAAKYLRDDAGLPNEDN